MSDRIDVLAVGAHPDDVELGCGGTLAVLHDKGYSTGIIHLTRGERGTRGTPEERQEEAENAAAALDVAQMRILDFGDGALRTGDVEEDSLIEILRQWRPELVLAPAPRDRHPDHGRAHRLTVDACFYAGLARRGSGAPHRPGALFSYPQHDLAEPAFIVDVTAGWERKMTALDAYASQIHSDDRDTSREEPQTKVSAPAFRAAIEGRARHFGQQINVGFGEPFMAAAALAVDNPLLLVPGGLR